MGLPCSGSVELCMISSYLAAYGPSGLKSIAMAVTTACHRGRREGPTASHPRGHGAAKMEPWTATVHRCLRRRWHRPGESPIPPRPHAPPRLSSLCDITHGRIQAKDQWRTVPANLSVPFSTYGADGQPPTVRAVIGDRLPAFVAKTDRRIVTLLAPTQRQERSCVSSRADERIRHGRLSRTRPGRPHSPEESLLSQDQPESHRQEHDCAEHPAKGLSPGRYREPPIRPDSRRHDRAIDPSGRWDGTGAGSPSLRGTATTAGRHLRHDDVARLRAERTSTGSTLGCLDGRRVHQPSLPDTSRSGALVPRRIVDVPLLCERPGP